jgi:hypothetical protein
MVPLWPIAWKWEDIFVLLKTQTTSSLKKELGRSKIASRICSFWEII